MNEYIAIVTAMGYKAGDLLENSGGVRPDLKPIVDVLQAAHPATVRAARNLLQLVDEIVVDVKESGAIDNVVPFPKREEPAELSENAMEKLTAVMKAAGFETRKAARGPEREVRFYGEASAGEGVEFFDEIPEDYRQIPQWAWKKGARGIFKVKGWSMLDMGIIDGHIIFVKPTPEPANGSTVIATVNRKVFIKKLKRDDRGVPVRLESRAPGYEPIKLNPDDDVQFFGVAIGNTGDL